MAKTRPLDALTVAWARSVFGAYYGATAVPPPDRLVHDYDLWVLDHVIGNAGP